MPTDAQRAAMAAWDKWALRHEDPDLVDGMLDAGWDRIQATDDAATLATWTASPVTLAALLDAEQGDDAGTVTCDACGGNGERVTYREGGRVVEDAACQRCDGSGRERVRAVFRAPAAAVVAPPVADVGEPHVLPRDPQPSDVERWVEAARRVDLDHDGQFDLTRVALGNVAMIGYNLGHQRALGEAMPGGWAAMMDRIADAGRYMACVEAMLWDVNDGGDVWGQAEGDVEVCTDAIAHALLQGAGPAAAAVAGLVHAGLVRERDGSPDWKCAHCGKAVTRDARGDRACFRVNCFAAHVG